MQRIQAGSRAAIDMIDVHPLRDWLSCSKLDSGALAGQDSLAVSQLIELSSADRADMLAPALSADAGSVQAQIDALNAASDLETGSTSAAHAAEGTPVSGALRFHVPFTFDCTALRSFAQSELDSANARLDEKSAQRETLTRRIAEIKDAIDKVSDSTGSGPFSIGIPRSALMMGFDLELAVATETEPAVDQELLEAQAEKERCERSMRVIEQLEGIKPDATAYALLLVCDGLPKAPHPDRDLFSPPN